MWNAGLDEAKAGIKNARGNINNLRYADDTILMAESKEELDESKEPLDESKRGEWKSWLKTQHSKNEDHVIWFHQFSSVQFSSVQFISVAQSYPTLCDTMNLSTPGFPVHHQLPEFTQTHVHRVNDAIQPSHPLSSPSPPAPNPSQHQSLFQWVNSSHEVAKVLEFQL